MKNSILFISFLLVSLCYVNGFSQNSDKEMQQILKEKRTFNQTAKKIEGYRIQLYNGLSENTARSRQGAFAAFFPEISTRLFYEQPEWKVQTSTFRNKLQAYKAWIKVKEEFEGTFIFEHKK